MVSEITQRNDLEEAQTVLRHLWTEADDGVPQVSRDRLKAILLRHRDDIETHSHLVNGT